jgi:hypothetical protein
MTYSEFLYYVTPQWSPDGSFSTRHCSPWRSVGRTATTHCYLAYSSRWLCLPLRLAAWISLFWLWRGFRQTLTASCTLHLPQQQIRFCILLNVRWQSGYALYADDARTVDSWSPDGAHFLYSVGESNQMLLGRVGENPAPLTDFDRITKIKWVNPQYFVFVHPSDTGFELLQGR